MNWNRKSGMALALLGLGLLGACSSGGGAHGHKHYGHVSSKIIDLYDQGMKGGMMELEIDRDGNIYEAEADIHPHLVPKPAMAAVMKAAGGGDVIGAEIEFGAHDKAYEVKIMKDGVRWEFVVTPEGEILETEQELRRQDVPANVISAGLGALPGQFKSVEIITAGEHVFYHVKTSDGVANYKAVVGVDGTLWNAVREARAEIEIPLAR